MAVCMISVLLVEEYAGWRRESEGDTCNNSAKYEMHIIFVTSLRMDLKDTIGSEHLKSVLMT